jgi:TfoX/Sxy family transcriptional regulator of competence genes
MAREYLKRLTALIREVTSGRFKKDIKLEYKHFFSGAAVYANGKMCISLTPVGFALKLPEESRNTLLKLKGTKPLRYFPQGPIKKDYVILSKTVLNDAKVLRHWVRLSIEYVALPPEPVGSKHK